VIGKAHFSIPRGKGETVRVHLSAKGSSLVRKAGRRGLKVMIRGSHMKTGTVVLKRARRTVQRRCTTQFSHALSLEVLAAAFDGAPLDEQQRQPRSCGPGRSVMKTAGAAAHAGM
jgi:hypothetical protein